MTWLGRWVVEGCCEHDCGNLPKNDGFGDFVVCFGPDANRCDRCEVLPLHGPPTWERFEDARLYRIEDGRCD